MSLAERAAKERRLRALAEAVLAYEGQFGEITEAELAAQQHLDRHNVIAVRPRRRRRRV